MKKNYLIICLLVLLAACSQHNTETPEPTEFGYLSMSISVEVISEPASGRVAAVPTDDWLVTIYNASDDSEVMSFDPFSSAPDEVQLPTGEYYIEAHSNNFAEAAFENPYYFGRSDNFTIDKEELKTIDIEAKLANCKVAINFSPEVTSVFDTYSGQVEVVSSGTTLAYAQGETREGYFVVEPLAVEVYLSYTKLDGTTIDRTFNASIDAPQPATLYNINVDATLEDGQIIFNLTVDEGVDTVDIDLGDDNQDPNANWVPGEDWVDTRDSTNYGTVQIGDQVWMSENLRYLPEVHSAAEFVEQNDNRLPAYGVYGYHWSDINEAKETTNFEKFGVIYNWYAATEETTNETDISLKGACPTGWHVSSDSDWTQLTDFLGGSTTSGGLLKTTGLSDWESPNEGANNETGFSALPGGARSSLNGGYQAIGVSGNFWTSSEGRDTTRAWHRGIYHNDIFLSRVDYFKTYGLSVRCVKD